MCVLTWHPETLWKLRVTLLVSNSSAGTTKPVEGLELLVDILLPPKVLELLADILLPPKVLSFQFHILIFNSFYTHKVLPILITAYSVLERRAKQETYAEEQTALQLPFVILYHLKSVEIVFSTLKDVANTNYEAFLLGTNSLSFYFSENIFVPHSIWKDVFVPIN